MKKPILTFIAFAMYGSVAFGLDIGIEKNKKLCDRGNAINCFNVGFLLQYSVGSARHQSNKYYNKACDLGQASFCLELGRYYSGSGYSYISSIILDKQKAREYYQKACLFDESYCIYRGEIK